MKLHSALSGLLLAALSTLASPAFAIVITTYTASYLYGGPGGNVQPLGFGRLDAAESGSPVTELGNVTLDVVTLNTVTTDTVTTPDAYTPGVLPFTFHDIFYFKGLRPGTFNFNTTLNAVGNLAFGLVMFESFTGGPPQSIDFAVAPNYASASGSGSFNVGAGCDVTACLVMHIYGWDDGSTAANYAGLSNVSAVVEPQSYALLLAGLGVLGFLARTRSRS